MFIQRYKVIIVCRKLKITNNIFHKIYEAKKYFLAYVQHNVNKIHHLQAFGTSKHIFNIIV